MPDNSRNAPVDSNGMPAITQCPLCKTWKADDNRPCEIRECVEEQMRKAEAESRSKATTNGVGGGKA